MCSTQQSCHFSHDLTVCRVHCALFGHPRPSYKPRSSTHLPTCFREAWSSTTPTHASFYLCTDPEQPAMMLAVQPCPRNWHISRASVHTHALPSPVHTQANSPPSSLPSPVHTHVRLPLPSFFPPTHAPPVSLPSIFMRPPSRSPPSSLPAPTPRASRPTHAPSVALPSTHAPSSIPSPIASRLAPLHLPSPAPGVLLGLRPTLRRTVSDRCPVWATCGVGRVAVPSFVGLAFGCIIYLEPE